MTRFNEEFLFNEFKNFVENKYHCNVTLEFIIPDKYTLNNNEPIPILFNIVFTEGKSDTYPTEAKKNFFYIGYMLNELLMTYQCFGIEDTLCSLEYSIDSILNENHHDINVYKR